MYEGRTLLLLASRNHSRRNYDAILLLPYVVSFSILVIVKIIKSCLPIKLKKVHLIKVHFRYRYIFDI